MKHETASCEQDLQDLLTSNRAYANGKNSPVTHLYATVATSRFDIENIFGIYLTRPAFAWMALWMAVTDRTVLRKRQLAYRSPQGGDSIGSIVIGGTHVSQGQLLRSQAFLYLFEPDVLPTAEVDFFPGTNDEQVRTELLARGYTWKQIERRGESRRALVFPQEQRPSTIGLDAWQVVCVGVDQLVPTTQVTLTSPLIAALYDRVQTQRHLPDREYLIL